eukprot:6046625-Amphidinium_carterae.1
MAICKLNVWVGEESFLNPEQKPRKLEPGNRTNWAEWTDAMAFFGWLAVHDVLPDAFQIAFDKATAKAAASVVFQGDDVPDVATSLPMIDVLNAEKLCPMSLNAPYEETTSAALFDKVTIERAKYALSLQAALAFFKRGVFKEIFLLQVTLEPERKLMAALLHSKSMHPQRHFEVVCCSLA